MTQSPFTRRILLVEDEQLTRVLLEGFLQRNGFEVLGAESATHAASLSKEFDPDAMVVDISLGDGPSGLDLILAMKNANPHLAFVVLSNYAIPPFAIQDLPKVAYLQKGRVGEARLLVQALESVLTDRDPREQFPLNQPNPISSLTQNQLEVLSWMAAGLTNHEIAKRRGTTIQSTEQLIKRIYDKIGLKRDEYKSLRIQAVSLYTAITGSRRAL